MKLTIIKTASLGILLGISTISSAADWLNYVVRTSGLGWSDGYHAYDQCPPCQRGHFPIKPPFALPGYGAAQGPHAPYYFEETLPAAPAQPATAPLSDLLPSPQARYNPRSRYFEALQAQSFASEQGIEARQTEQQQARRPAIAPPF